ncbi:cell wall hydrolase [Gracilibacillus salinarum]|uniref:Cell wall hydrolase n=1 Tax=Gracilibacillus salinarum TaxID=2932255 RepID=A0ABY4GQ09_9BACI|nr:cell wall hydrolase [Gracilibacillus salinarum]UOQ86486.1 cell wall hydrolase [Gracilibacillus salinarum]
MKNKMKILISSLLVVTGLTVLPGFADAYTVKQGDTFWKIAQNYNVSTNELMNVNNYSSSMLYPGAELTIPSSVSDKEVDLLARLVRAEAQGEPYAGKVAVATVVLNRVDHADFPNTITEVVNETYSNGAIHAFSPVANGEINKEADSESVRAAKEAIAFRGQGQGSIYFYNPNTAQSDWIFSRETTVTIGDHVFAK